VEIVILLIFGVVGIVHLFGLWQKAMAIKSYRFEVSENRPSISIIVCAHNENDNLKALLPLLQNQQYESHEIIIVLDRCADGSEEIVKKFQNKNLAIITIDEVVSNFHPKKRGITQAIEKAKGEWILLTDADCRPTNQWISEMAKGMHPKTDVVIGLSPYTKFGGILNLLIQYETFQTALQFVSSASAGKPYMALGRNLAYRKSKFIEQNGFGVHSQVMGGDDDLFVQSILTKDNFRIVLAPESWVESIPKTSGSAYFRQKTRHFSVGKHYPDWVKSKESIRWAIHIVFWILFFFSFAINPFIGVSILATVLWIKGISFNIVAKRLGKRFNPIWLPFVDLLYVVILPLLSLRSLLVKNSTWK